MVQIGDYHIGKAESAVTPYLSVTEVSYLWDALVARYKCVEETQFYHKYCHDPDFKVLLKYGISFIKNQVDVIEKQMNTFQLPLPNRPPLNINDPDSANLSLSDQFMFRQVFEGCQSFIDFFARASRSMVTSDNMRKIFIGFLTEELTLFDKLCKFAKLKGWLEVTPIYKQ